MMWNYHKIFDFMIISWISMKFSQNWHFMPILTKFCWFYRFSAKFDENRLFLLFFHEKQLFFAKNSIKSMILCYFCSKSMKIDFQKLIDFADFELYLLDFARFWWISSNICSKSMKSISSRFWPNYAINRIIWWYFINFSWNIR